jgi:hypothetical protein
MATLHDDGLIFPMRDPHAGFRSEQWERDNQAEIASRPHALPIDQRKPFTGAELQQIRQNVAAGMKQDAAVKAVVALRK